MSDFENLPETEEAEYPYNYPDIVKHYEGSTFHAGQIVQYVKATSYINGWKRTERIENGFYEVLGYHSSTIEGEKPPQVILKRLDAEHHNDQPIIHFWVYDTTIELVET